MQWYVQIGSRSNGYHSIFLFYFGCTECYICRIQVAACREVEQGYEKRVKITVVVVQKRHHTRFFPGNTGVGREDRKNNNVPAGTIVDKVIVRPTENQFYLVSHQSIQGVAKPTKYCILQDEGNHSIDDLQELTYNVRRLHPITFSFQCKMTKSGLFSSIQFRFPFDFLVMSFVRPLQPIRVLSCPHVLCSFGCSTWKSVHRVSLIKS